MVVVVLSVVDGRMTNGSSCEASVGGLQKNQQKKENCTQNTKKKKEKAVVNRYYQVLPATTRYNQLLTLLL